jgi:hypothetical protein
MRHLHNEELVILYSLPNVAEKNTHINLNSRFRTDLPGHYVHFDIN